MTASLAAISDVSVPAHQGSTLALDGSGTTNTQTFTITRTSGSANIAASIAQGPFWTLNVNYTDTDNPQNNFSGPITFQLFQDLTPNTVGQIQAFTNNGYYTNKAFTRIRPGFQDPQGFVVQGGALNADGTGSSNQSGTPFANENLQQLAFAGHYQLAMANSGGRNSNDTQFFITTDSPNNELGYNYTIFGQLVSGLATLNQMTQVPTVFSPIYNETSSPAHSLVIQTASVSTTNPNGTVILDTTQAELGESATFLVTATDPSDGSTTSQSFTVTVGAYAGPAQPAINFRPLADPVTASTTSDTAKGISLAGQSGYPSGSQPATLTYALLTQPAHGTISDFNASAGTFTYTPTTGFVGTDSFTYQVTATGPQSTPASTTSNSTPVTINVTQSPSGTPTTPTITWSNPSGIVYGQVLGAGQLNATASVPGTFTYSPAAGTVLPAGQAQAISVTFTPTDLANFTAAQASATIDVAKATPAITWTNPADIVYGTALGVGQLNATAGAALGGNTMAVAGVFTYSPAPGTVLHAGQSQTLSVTFTPYNTTSYATAQATATVNVKQATPTITWHDPADISAGTPLGSAQLNATADVPGTFTYTPTPGTVLPVGQGQSLAVSFAPNNAVDYTTAQDSATINVVPSSTTIPSPTPTPTPTPTSTPLAISQVQPVTGGNRRVRSIQVGFRGSVNIASAQDLNSYRLTMRGRGGSFTAKNAKHIRLGSVAYNAATNTVTLTPRKPFVLNKKVQLLIHGQPGGDLAAILS